MEQAISERYPDGDVVTLGDRLLCSHTMAIGTAYTVVKREDGIKVLVYGGILIGIFVALSAQQFGAVPVTFDGVTKLGLATFQAGPVMEAYHSIVAYILRIIGWVASVLMLLGGILFIAGRNGNNTAVTIYYYLDNKCI